MINMNENTFNKRRKVEERVFISKKEKISIMRKSKGLCSHCGVELKINKNLTLEHAIPLSEGGTNDDRNLVALCSTCNKDKRSSVYNINSYFKYLTKHHKKLLNDYFEEYLDTFDNINANNFCSTDAISFKEKIVIPRKGCNKNFVKSGKNFLLFTKTLEKDSTIYKVNYSDLDSIYDMLKERDLGFDLKCFISYFFKNGIIYFKKDSNDLVSFVFFCQLVSSIRTLADGTVMTIPLLFCKVYINKKYFLPNKLHSFLSCMLSANMAKESIIKDAICHSKGNISSVLTLWVNDFDGKSINNVLNISSKGGYNVPQGCINNKIELYPVYDSSKSEVVSRYLEEFKQEKDTSYFLKKYLLDDRTDLYSTMSSVEWSGLYSLYDELGLLNQEYLLGMCPSEPLVSLLVNSLSECDLLDLHNFLVARKVSIGYHEENIYKTLQELRLPQGLNKNIVTSKFVENAVKKEERILLNENYEVVNKNYNYALYKAYFLNGRVNIPCTRMVKRVGLL